MAFVYTAADITQNGAGLNALTLVAGADHYLKEGVTIASTNGGVGIYSAGAVNTAIHGVVIGNMGVNIGVINTTSEMHIGPTGVVVGHGFDAIDIVGGSFVLHNFGLVSAINSGDALELNNSGGNAATVTVINHGTMSADGNVVDVLAGTVTGVIFNYGTMSSFEDDALFFSQGGDRVYNRGLIASAGSNSWINTAVEFNAGHDLYDGAGGRAVGRILGGSGNDTLIGGIGADRLEGGNDDDEIYFTPEDVRFGIVTGGTGTDTGFNMDDVTPFTIFLTNHSFESYFGSAANEAVTANFVTVGVTVEGGDGHDTIEGSSVSVLNDILGGGGGDDVINGYGGNDIVNGGLGADYLIGGAGNDTLTGDQGDDTIFGGDDGDFSLDGGEGADVIMGEAGNDTIYGGGGDDVWLDGGDGADVIEGGAGNDLIRGEAGSDPWLNGGAGDDTIIGGLGADNLVGDAGADQFQFYSLAEAGDTIFGFVSGTDKLFVAQSGFGQLTGYIANGAPAPINAGPHLLYNTTTGVLTYDANGTTAGGQTVLATLNGAPTLLYEDLLFV